MQIAHGYQHGGMTKQLFHRDDDYETVFDGDFGDDVPFLSDEAVGERRALIRPYTRSTSSG